MFRYKIAGVQIFVNFFLSENFNENVPKAQSFHKIMVRICLCIYYKCSDVDKREKGLTFQDF